MGRPLELASAVVQRSANQQTLFHFRCAPSSPPRGSGSRSRTSSLAYPPEAPPATCATGPPKLSRMRFDSSIGRLPKKRLNSLLNCDALS